MDWLSLDILTTQIIVWWPWLNFFNENWILQFLIVYGLYNIYYNNHLIYVVFYLMWEIFILGIFLSFFQMELFTAFLWLAETAVIFISILLVFYLNVYGNVDNSNKSYSFSKIAPIIFFFLSSTYFYCFPSENEFLIPLEFNSTTIWDDYYEALNINLINDLYGLYLSYYRINSFEFLFIGLILLIGSLICVNINKISKNNKMTNYLDIFIVFDFFKDALKYVFMRKQNLVDQGNNQPTTRIFKKKININYT